VTGLNEYIAIDDYAALRASGVWMEAFCAALERIGYPGRPIGFNSGVGNPEHNYICDEKGIERQMPLMVRGARALMNAEGGFGHHAYHGSRADGFCTLTTNDERGNPNRLHYSMRSLLSIDPVLLEHGVVVDHYLTALAAIYYDPIHRMRNAGAGWRWPATMGEGAADRYVDELVMLNGFFREWNAAHNGRLPASPSGVRVQNATVGRRVLPSEPLAPFGTKLWTALLVHDDGRSLSAVDLAVSGARVGQQSSRASRRLNLRPSASRPPNPDRTSRARAPRIGRPAPRCC
jgi:hypothetical protein